MEVILNKDLEKIGKAGQIVKVKDGFARNFLIPRGLALTVTSGNLRQIEQKKARETLQLEKTKQNALELAERLAHLSLTIPALTHEDDKLYGSIKAEDLLQALKDEGFDINKDFIQLEEPIKALGIYEVPLKLHPEVLAKVKIWVVKK